MKHLLSAADLSKDHALEILDTAEQMHDVQHRDVKKLPALRGRTVVNLFFEDSTRTRSSFEIAGKRLGDVEFLRPVRPGDTLTGSTVIDAIEFDDRDRALVTSSAELRNADGKPVMRTVVEAYVHARPGRATSDT